MKTQDLLFRLTVRYPDRGFKVSPQHNNKIVAPDLVWDCDVVADFIDEDGIDFNDAKLIREHNRHR